MHQKLPKQKTLKALPKWIDAFLQHLDTHQNYSNHTLKAYKRDLQKFLTFTEGNTDTFSELTTRTCKQFIHSLNKQNYTAKTLARLLATLRSFWNFLLQNHITETNPWEGVKTPKIPRKLPTVAPHEKVTLFLESIGTESAIDCRDRAICELLYSSGIRVSECTQLDTTQLDPTSGEFRIIGKGDKERIGLFGTTAAYYIELYIAQARPQLDLNQDKALFLNKKGGRLTPRSIQRMIKDRTKACGLELSITPHTLRHSYATALYNGGADLKLIQELLGHENLATTQLYTHLSSKKMIDVILKHHPRDDT